MFSGVLSLSKPRFSRLRIVVFGIIPILGLPSISSSQVSRAASTGTNTVLTQLFTAFSGGQIVQSVQLSGNATWYGGSTEDSGVVTLSATANGSSQLQLSLASLGQRTESQTGTGPGASCQWTGNDGVQHSVDLGNCWRPDLWFLPAMSLQPSLLPTYLGTSDLGLSAVGSEGNSYRHVQNQLAFSSLSTDISNDLVERSTSDLGLDPTSFLPAVLAYSVHPDNGAAMPVLIEIRYGNYQSTNGVQIPFHIQRYVNGTLELDILLSSAQIN